MQRPMMSFICCTCSLVGFNVDVHVDMVWYHHTTKVQDEKTLVVRNASDSIEVLSREPSKSIL